jgi:hypothetical protein
MGMMDIFDVCRFPSANVVVGWQDVVYELCQVDAVMKLAADGHTMSIPVNALHNGWGPLVVLLDVL